MILWTILSTIPVLVLGIGAAPIESSAEPLRRLTQADFSDTTVNGLWCADLCIVIQSQAFDDLLYLTRLIEFFSPYCVHCKRFKPTWERLTLDKASKTSFGFGMAQVDCIAQGGKLEGIGLSSSIIPYGIWPQTYATNTMSHITLN